MSIYNDKGIPARPHCEICERAQQLLKGMRIMDWVEKNAGSEGENLKAIIAEDGSNPMDEMDHRTWYLAVALFSGYNVPLGIKDEELEGIAFDICQDPDMYREMRRRAEKILKEHGQ